MNPLLLLLASGGNQQNTAGTLQRLLDGPGRGALAQHYSDMIARRAASTFRNVGPDNLFDFPDRNTTLPDDVMTIRNSPGSWGERI